MRPFPPFPLLLPTVSASRPRQGEARVGQSEAGRWQDIRLHVNGQLESAARWGAASARW